MQRSPRALDWALVLVLGAAWLAALVYGVRDGIRTQHGYLPFIPSSAGRGEAYPVLVSLQQEPRANPPLRLGDSLLALEGDDLAGARSNRVVIGIAAAARERGFARLTVARGAERFESRLELTPTPYWWAYLPVSAALLGVAAFLLLRAPHWPPRRGFFVAAWIYATMLAASSPGRPPSSELMAGLYWLVWLVGSPVSIWCVQELTPSARPVPSWLRAIPLVVLAGQATYGVSVSSLPITRPFIETLGSANILVMCLGGIAGVTRAYRRSDALERRQIRWVALGFCLTFLGMMIYNETAGLVSEGPARLLTATMTLSLPLGVAVSVLAYGFLDVDRVISATASYALIGLSLLAAALAGLPAAAVQVAATLGVPAEPARFVLGVALLGLALLVHRALWPLLDRRFFRERHRREVGFEQLLDEIGRCTNLEELTRLPGERLDALLAPESIATYAREESLFTPVFVRGRTAPAAFEADSLLVRALEKRALPLAADGAALDPFDRAALETLGAAVLVPTRRGGDLAAFSCLGRKRSGDIYTREELAWLAAVANRCSELLVTLSDEVVLREARALQQSLRRYVPGAVADALAGGSDLEPGEREVSVLFVDIRGYTSFAERRRAEEIFSTLNAYTERVSRLVTERGGSVVEFNGDGMMAVFGAPRALERKERAAVEAAREIVESLGPNLAVGVGIATGEAFVGSIRATDRLIWSAIGNTTNLAARLQALTRELDAAIAVDATTRERAGYVCADFARHEGVAIRGRSDRHDVFALPLARAAG